MEWNSIETLPAETGMYIVAYRFPNGRRCVDRALFTEHFFEIDDMEGKNDLGPTFYTVHDDGYFKCEYITHWMPMPEFPKER